ncbi:hypothetical protein Pmani_018531 [Petrolisthes manimaculis]|uniref:Uncharacterized protein n=1 Tax=Petrolisthes manimaculis TaxID=1843537 RepID=A0AAE1U4S5_9EUCA|nr:hypothetical protein Pmani_018531 [Petrolisthes manimaculis]
MCSTFYLLPIYLFPIPAHSTQYHPSQKLFFPPHATSISPTLHPTHTPPTNTALRGEHKLRGSKPVQAVIMNLLVLSSHLYLPLLPDLLPLASFLLPSATLLLPFKPIHMASAPLPWPQHLASLVTCARGSWVFEEVANKPTDSYRL